MDWVYAIDIHREALRRILVMLVAMVGFDAARAGSPHTLPRHLHNAVARLLRPAEAAVRRLVIICARDVVVELPPRPPKPTAFKPPPGAPVIRVSQLGLAKFNLPSRRRATPTVLRVPLIDPIRDPFRRRPRRLPSRLGPRIWCVGMPDPPPRPPAPTPHDPLDMTRIGLRLDALQHALDDLPAQALHFARWRAARARDRREGRISRTTPLRGGYAYGVRRPGSRRPEHPIDRTLRDLNGLAHWSLEKRDTS